jgi:hypothetical protein
VGSGQADSTRLDLDEGVPNPWRSPPSPENMIEPTLGARPRPQHLTHD